MTLQGHHDHNRISSDLACMGELFVTFGTLQISTRVLYFQNISPAMIPLSNII